MEIRSKTETPKESGKPQKKAAAQNGAVDKMALAARNFPNLAKNQQVIDQLFNANKARIEQARQLFVSQKLAELKKANDSLEKEVAELKEKLVVAEVTGGVKQISVPKVEQSAIASKEQRTKEPIAAAAPQKSQEAKVQPEKKEKKATGGDKAAAATASDETIDIGRLDLRVGRIIHCEKHPDADALYLEKIDVGEAEPRTVVSGLVKHVPLDQMQNRLVVVMCNLKPAKMRGVESKAMVMCASSPEKVEIMEVDPSAKPGMSVVCPPFVHRPDAQLNPKKKVWETVAEDLLVSPEGIATWKGHPLLVDGKTHLVAPTLRNVHVK
ncbi:unnamed protein product, partial [Mesorhabditis belari]|uniref:tRNA-binding domain-containing protein n=1 Tax=Mesorhabditis belari TaxID=2138241 RepID=A0AAF3EQB4_9BILA